MTDKGTTRADPAARAARAWQRMLSGRRLDLLDPSPKDIEIEDIAHGLARVARWNGQTVGEHAFSVAQHALLVEEIAAAHAAGPDAALAARRPAARRAGICDRRSHQPVQSRDRPRLQGLRGKLLEAIHRRFGLPPSLPERITTAIKTADRVAAFYEATQLAGFTQAEANRYFGVPRGVPADPAPAPGARSIQLRSRSRRPSSWLASTSCRRSDVPPLFRHRRFQRSLDRRS